MLIVRNDTGPVGTYITARLRHLVEKDGLNVVVLDAREGLPVGFPTPTAVILGGSLDGVNDGYDWIAREEQWVRTLEDASIPILGICFGHQLVAKALGGRVATTKLVGGGRNIRVTRDSPLFTGIGNFRFNVSHQDQVTALPKKLVATATSDYCPVQAFQHVTKPIFGVQFHPCYDEDALDVTELACIRETFHPNKDGVKILGNFIRLARNHHESVHPHSVA